jgi:hypothetical protein
MQNTIVYHEGTASLEAVGTKVKAAGAVIKIGLDMHARLYVATAQCVTKRGNPRVRRSAWLRIIGISSIICDSQRRAKFRDALQSVGAK